MISVTEPHFRAAYLVLRPSRNQPYQYAASPSLNFSIFFPFTQSRISSPLTTRFTPYRTPNWSDNDSLRHRVTEAYHETLHALNADMPRVKMEDNGLTLED